MNQILSKINNILERKKTIEKIKKNISNKIEDSIYIIKLSKDQINNTNGYLYNYFTNIYDTIPGIYKNVETLVDLDDKKLEDIKKYCGIWFSLNINDTFVYFHKFLKKNIKKYWSNVFPSIGLFKLIQDIPNMLLLKNDTKYNLDILDEIIEKYNLDISILKKDYDILRFNYLSDNHPVTNYYLAAIICKLPQINGWINLIDSNEIFLKSPKLFLTLIKKYNITQCDFNVNTENHNILKNNQKIMPPIGIISFMNLKNKSQKIFADIYNEKNEQIENKDISNELLEYKNYIDEFNLTIDNNIVKIKLSKNNYYCYNKKNLIIYFKDKIKDKIKDPSKLNLLYNSVDNFFNKTIKEAIDLNNLTNSYIDKLKDDLKQNTKFHESLYNLFMTT